MSCDDWVLWGYYQPTSDDVIEVAHGTRGHCEARQREREAVGWWTALRKATDDKPEKTL